MDYKSGNQQGGLFDYQERQELLRQQTTPLDRLNEHLDWELFRLKLEGHLDYRTGPQGAARRGVRC